MFDQTFVSTERRSRRPLGVIASLLIQGVVICVSILISIAYTKGLPAAQLRALLIAPKAPVAPHVARNAPKAKNSAVVRPFRMVNQVVFAKPTSHPVQVAAAPAGFDVPGTLQTGSDNAGVPFLPGSVSSPALPQPPDSPAKPAVKTTQRIGGAVAQANLIHQVQPVYPQLAKAAGVQGTVEFTAVISTAGTIEHLQLVSGHPLLINAARDAVLQWRYRPTLLNGSPVEVVTQITVRFSLLN
ncbi:MAG: TonB family protein [Acidobacteriota bacterium]|nr:TonB family protein [Acidobacteriota bacterium]